MADGDGRFIATSLGAGRYRVSASSAGLAAAPHEVVLASGGSEDVELRARLTAIDEQLTVTATLVDTPLSRVPDSVRRS